jgi:uncharacterized protein YjbJ (UPF0337 family)
MGVAQRKLFGEEATRAAGQFPDAHSSRGTGQSIYNLEEENTMKSSTKDQTEGTFHEVKGNIKEKTGKVINNPNLENEGTVEKTAGEVQNKVGQVEKVLGV